MSDELVEPPSRPLPMPLTAATENDSDVDLEAVREVLAFVIASECYALPLSSVREILKVPVVTEVPRAGGDVLGIISVRGRITTVLDLRRRLRMPERPLTKAARVLLVDDGREVLGLLVDQVLSVYRLRPDEVELAAVMGGDTADHVAGVGRPRGPKGARANDESQGEMLILLDPEPLLRR